MLATAAQTISPIHITSGSRGRVEGDGGRVERDKDEGGGVIGET